jgi:hypothetical protein
MNFVKLLPLALCATLSVGVTSGAVAAGAPQAPALPFTATLTITEQITVTGTPCPLAASVSGSGTASYLGQVTVRSDDCIVPEGASLTFMSNSVVLTASNGDKMFASYAGTVVQASGAISASYAISGGTGRFVNAKGSGEIEGAEDTSPFVSNPGGPRWTVPGQITLSGKVRF